MALRVLVIDDEEVYRRLLAQHVATAFDSPAVAEYDPATKGRLPSEFQASGYDVVLLDDQPGAGSGMEWLKDLRRRPGFPPIVYMMSEPSRTAEAEAGKAGAAARARAKALLARACEGGEQDACSMARQFK